MKWHKKLLNSDRTQAFLSYCLYHYMRFVYATTRWQILQKESLHTPLQQGKKIILTAWHGRLFILPKAYYQKDVSFPLPPIHAVISLHNDGEIIARIIERFGHGLVRGSSFRGAMGAIRECLKILKKNQCLGLTPDGPRGPRMQVGGNVIELARMSGAVIVPCSFSIARSFILNSWDKFMFPLPFQKGVLIYGTPIQLDHDASTVLVEEKKLILEEEMNRITHQADKMMDISPVMPEPR